MKEKMMVRLERERLQARVDALEAQLMADGGQSKVAPSAPSPTAAGLGGTSKATAHPKGASLPVGSRHEECAF